MTDEVMTRRSRRSQRARQRQKLTVTGVLGELLITVGVIALLFVAWQMWIGDMIIGAQAKSAANSLSEEWEQAAQADAAERGETLPESDPEQEYNTLTAEPPAIAEPGSGEDFATLIVPRLDIKFTVAEGTQTWESLDLGKVGHYNDTGMPGDEGNFAVAGHRGSHGAPFMNLPAMRAGDAVVVETKAGWYTYRYRNLEYVPPTAVDVLAATPRAPEVGVTGRYLTMTTCSPRYGWSERAVGYATFEKFTPRVQDGKKPESIYLPKES